MEASSRPMGAGWWAVLAAAGVLTGPACGSGASPTTPEPGTGVVITFEDPARAIAAHEGAIRRLVEDSVVRARDQLDVGRVNVLVRADRARTIAGWGIGGFAPDGATLEIAIDPGYADLSRVLETRLPPMVAHEVHHVVRWRGPGYGRTLLEAMVSEGLADHFAIELLSAAVPPWSQSFPEDETSLYLGRARPLFDRTDFDYDAWFYGPTADLPRWTGYTLGYRLVAAHKARSGLSAARLVHAPAGDFRSP